MAGNINDCLADTNCIGMVENVGPMSRFSTS